MSYTELFKFNKEGNAEWFAETKNAHRGAMAVWHRMEDKYLPEIVPLWASKSMIAERKEKGERFYRFSPSEMKEVWALLKQDNVSTEDKIVLGSTFDNVIVVRENLLDLIKLFNSFDGQTSLKEQAKEIENLLETDSEFIAIGWNQTSVNGDTWANAGGYDEDDEPIPYNVLTGDKHWDLFKEVSR